MSQKQRPVKVGFLVPDDSWSSTVISPAEIFHGVGLKSGMFQSQGYQGFETTFLRCSRHKVSGFSGLPLETRYFADDSVADRQFDVILVPSVWNLSLENLRQSREALAWLAEQHDQGAIVAGLVNGVFYLAEAGLLDDREATIHWASVNIFRQRYPRVKVRPQIQTVEADRILTTSTTPATFDVALMLIQRFMGDRAAEQASLYFRIRDQDAPLPEFLEPASKDPLVDAARDILRMNYGDAELCLQKLARDLNVTPRTLSRRFVSATGISPIQYLIRQRLEVARKLLQSTDLQIQLIAEQAGFGSATVFCRSFRQAFSATPKSYRLQTRGGSGRPDRHHMMPTDGLD